ncbi:MAG TPA: hypothetical protein VGZ48_04955 [Candidatus Acidoferrales bacterium]|nr:hypothetical protein [Candidatus Acidoferrales bacterium]
MHIVTAKHVAEGIQGSPFFLGANFKDGKAGWLRSDMRWWYHPSEEDNVDVAVTIFAPSSTRFDVEYIPESKFVNDDDIRKYGIGVGDEINVIGLFTQFVGSTRHFPIVRTGNIAMMPSDKLPVEKGEMEVYLAEGRSIGGLSGSPVFVRQTVKIEGMVDEHGEAQFISGLGPTRFLGLIRGHWDVFAGATRGRGEMVNMGVSIIIPAKKILEVLYHPDLVALRKSQDDVLAEMSPREPGT